MSYALHWQQNNASMLFQGGNLTEAIKHKHSAMGWYQNGRKVARSIAQGLAHLHSHEMVYLAPSVAYDSGWRR